MSNEHSSGLAGEYVLGTLPEPERAAFETDLAHSDALRAEVLAWETRLLPLATVPPLQPPARLWLEIENRIDRPGEALRVVGPPSIQNLRRSVRRWRITAAAMGGLAAAMAVLVLLLGRSLATQGGGQVFVAAVNRGGEAPALIVQVNLRRRSVQVRSVAAQTPADRSLQLWYVSEGQKPSSLGVISQQDTLRSLPAVLRDGSLAGQRLAVSVEPKGGSPTGSPTGPVIYSGQLIRTDP